MIAVLSAVIIIISGWVLTPSKAKAGQVFSCMFITQVAGHSACVAPGKPQHTVSISCFTVALVCKEKAKITAEVKELRMQVCKKAGKFGEFCAQEFSSPSPPSPIFFCICKP